METFNIEENFPFDQHHSVAIVGSRNAGKTTLMKSLWPFFKKKFDFIIVFCNNPQAEIYEFMDEKDRRFVFDIFHPNILEQISEFQKKSGNLFDIGVFFDDCSSTRGNKFDDAIQQLYIRGRNMKCTVLFSTQSPSFIAKDNRANIDYLFLLKTRTVEMKNVVAERFLNGIVPIPPEIKGKQNKLDYINRWASDHTDNNEIIVVDFRHDDGLFRYKVKL